jgi:hypothetical protein
VTLSWKNSIQQGLAEWLKRPCKCEALSSNSSTDQKKEDLTRALSSNPSPPQKKKKKADLEVLNSKWYLKVQKDEANFGEDIQDDLATKEFIIQEEIEHTSKNVCVEGKRGAEPKHQILTNEKLKGLLGHLL